MASFNPAIQSPPNRQHSPQRRGSNPHLNVALPQAMPPNHAPPKHSKFKQLVDRVLSSAQSSHQAPQAGVPTEPKPNTVNFGSHLALEMFSPAQESFDVQTLPGAPAGSSKPPVKPAPTEIDQNTQFWETYNKTGDVEDKDFVKTSGGDLDVLLIFAGLFSATNTAFIIESYKNLQVDQAGETNRLLRAVYNATIHVSSATIDEIPFVASPRDIAINACFFASLCCSLSAAFGAVLAKQWLTQYDRDGGGSLQTPSARGRERQQKYEGRDKWHLEDVIVTLPTLLQFSLFFFFAGLVIFLWPLNKIVTAITLGFTIATFLFYVITITISVFNESAPFQTRLSPLLRSPFPRIWGAMKRVAQRVRSGFKETKRSANISCTSYLLERLTKPEDLKIVADGFVSLIHDPDAVAITDPFVEFHLKPTGGVTKPWSVPSLYGSTRSSLLKILNVLLKKWKEEQLQAIKTPLYNLDTTTLYHDLPGELRKAFLADPADTESCHCIVDILITLPTSPSSSSPDQSKTEMTPSQKAWLEDDVMKNLECGEDVMKGLDSTVDMKRDVAHRDVAARNTLKMLDLATRGRNERRAAWNMIKGARDKNPRLKKIIHSMVLREVSSFQPGETPDDLKSTRLLEWLARSEDVVELADALEALPPFSEKVLAAARPLVNEIVETLITFHFKPALELGGWWRLSGLRGQDRKWLLKVLRVIIARWKYLEWNLKVGNGSLPPLNTPSFVCSLRAELWEAYLAEPEDSETAQIIVIICQSLPSPDPLSDDDDISVAAMRKVGSDMSLLFQKDKVKPTILKHCFSLLCSNADSLISFANFHTISLAPGLSRAIPEQLRVNLWHANTPVGLEDFWRTAFGVQLLPVFFPDELLALNFAKYVDLWFRHYAKHDLGTSADNKNHQALTTHDRMRHKRLYWTYILSLQQMLVIGEAPQLSKELKANGHQAHLLEILDDVNCQSYPTCAPLALHLFLRLWSDDPSQEMAEGVKGILNALTSGDLSLGLIILDTRIYAEASRTGDSREQWCQAVSKRVVECMAQMMRLLKTYLEAAVARGFIGSKEGETTLVKYHSWCGEMGRYSGKSEWDQLYRSLHATIRSDVKEDRGHLVVE